MNGSAAGWEAGDLNTATASFMVRPPATWRFSGTCRKPQRTFTFWNAPVPTANGQVCRTNDTVAGDAASVKRLAPMPAVRRTRSSARPTDSGRRYEDDMVLSFPARGAGLPAEAFTQLTRYGSPVR